MGRGEQKDVVMEQGEVSRSIRQKFVFEKVDLSFLGNVLEFSFLSAQPKIVSALVLDFDDKGKEEEVEEDEPLEVVNDVKVEDHFDEFDYSDYHYDDDDEYENFVEEYSIDTLTASSFRYAEQWERKTFSIKSLKQSPWLRERRKCRHLRKPKVSSKTCVHFRDLQRDLQRYRYFTSSSSNQTSPVNADDRIPLSRPPSIASPSPSPSPSRSSYAPSLYSSSYSSSSSSSYSSSYSYSFAPSPDVPVPSRNHRNVERYRANVGNLDADLERAIRESLAVPVHSPSPSPSSRQYTPEEAARLLVEIQNREITPEDYQLLLILDEALKKKTVPQDLLNSFPESLWNPSESHQCGEEDSKDEEDEAESCRICLCEYVEKDVLCTLPCQHHFHKGCIVQWLSSNSAACPLDGLEIIA